MLLETAGCLEYSEEDLPPDLCELGLTYHAHLPLDLDWKGDESRTHCSLDCLHQKIAFLQPCRYVLHPPSPGCLTRLVARCPWLHPTLCVENIRHGDLHDIWDEITALNLGVCLDLGHMVSYGQYDILQFPDFFDHVRMLHVYGGESAKGHLGLETLPDSRLLRDILIRMDRDCVLVVELFRLDELCSSLHMLRSWLDTWGMSHD